MKYKVTRYQPKTITLSEYCENCSRGLEVRQLRDGRWTAFVGLKYGDPYMRIDDAIESLCRAVSDSDCKVTPGTDLEAAE